MMNSHPPSATSRPEADLYVEHYLSSFADVMTKFPSQAVVAANAALLSAYERGAKVFIAGNGGSASLASHLACDLEKTTTGTSPRAVHRRFQVMSLVDNVASLTAWANDECFECIFSERLKGRAAPGDILLVISASGNSPNILEALRTARDLGMTSIAWLGFEGGQALSMCDIPVHLPSQDYGLVESTHALIAHLTTGWLTRATARYRSLVALGDREETP